MLQQVRQLKVVDQQPIGVLVNANRNYLRVPIRNMFIILPVTFFTQGSDDISKGTQALVDVLRLL